MTTPETSGTYRALTSVVALVGIEVLVVDADHSVHAGIEQLLSEANLHVTCTDSAAAALDRVRRQFYSVALVDIDTPEPAAGIRAIRAIKDQSPTTMVIAMTPRRSYDDAVEAVRAGAIDLVLKAPESVAYLKERVLDAAGRSVGRREVDSVLIDVKTVHEDFLNRFMETERRAIDLQDRAAGKDPAKLIAIDTLRVLIIDDKSDLYGALADAKRDGIELVHATSGGEGLDRVSSGHFHYAMVADDITDLPAWTVARTIRNQHPDVVVLKFKGPGPAGKVQLVETTSARTLISPFTDGAQLLDRLDDLTEAWRVKARERRYTQAFRERHYDFLRRYVELKTKIERAMHESAG